MYMETNFHSTRERSGFALLMTLIVVSVVISIGLSVLDLSIKQVRLATNSRDSEAAFHAANAGVECARYTRRVNSNRMENGQSITPLCFGSSASPNSVVEVTSGVSGDGEVYKYTYNISWGTTADPRCTEVVTMVATATAMVGGSAGAGLTTNNMRTHIPAYTANSWRCEAGERCTVLSVQGYNRGCSASYGFGTVEREVLLQF